MIADIGILMKRFWKGFEISKSELDRVIWSAVKITVAYVGSSLLAPLIKAEQEINARHGLGLQVAAHNFGGVFSDQQWEQIETDLHGAEVIFLIHVMDGENAARLIRFLSTNQPPTVVVINCMPELMKRTRLGKLHFARLPGIGVPKATTGQNGTSRELREARKANRILHSVSSWISGQVQRKASGNKEKTHGRAQYLKFANRLPSMLRYVPGAGPLRDVKNYLMLFCYFLQPSPQNIRSMLLYALKNYVNDDRLEKLEIEAPELLPVIGIYHPDAPSIFKTVDEYLVWDSKRPHHQGANASIPATETIGLLLMRPQIVSNARQHYDGLIRAIEAEGLKVMPVISTLMDNREACERFFVEAHRQDSGSRRLNATGNGQPTTDKTWKPRVSQIVSLTGFSFVGGPGMNDSEAAVDFISDFNVPYRSLVSLDTQTVESWRESFTGLNPIQTGMQVAIPEIDGATEPHVFGGIQDCGTEPIPFADRCQRIAKRLKNWQRLQTCPRDQLKLALVLYCFPPNRGNIGTAADLDVLASVFRILEQFRAEGYTVDIPKSVDELREKLLGGNSASFGTTANVVYRMAVSDYLRLCPFAGEIETEWGIAPGSISSADGHLLIQGLDCGNLFIGIQPTFGYEDDPMRLLMSKGGAPHHGFAAFYTYLEQIFQADAIVHVGTHGALEFMPGKQVGLSSECWPDRLIGNLPNIYIYSVNNPSEGTIAKRRSYAELISYLTPPIENAGLYKGLAALKESINAYRATDDEQERLRLFEAIAENSRQLNLNVD
jgi:magnesium chelatase subunit H